MLLLVQGFVVLIAAFFILRSWLDLQTGQTSTFRFEANRTTQPLRFWAILVSRMIVVAYCAYGAFFLATQ